MGQSIRVGEWQVRPDVGTVTRGGDSIRLEPKVMGVLVYLAEHGGEVLSKERIIQAVWSDAFVTDEVLTNAISELRKAFGDDARNPTVIETLSRRGYRLIAPTTLKLETLSGQHGILDHSRRPIESFGRAGYKLWVSFGVALLVLVTLFLTLPNDAPDSSQAQPVPIDSIAVLPFLNATEDPDLDDLCLSLAESVSYRLSGISNLFWLAFVSDESGTPEVYVRSAFGDSGNKLVSIGGGTDPVWLPDGTGLLYSWLGQIFRVPFRMEKGSLAPVKAEPWADPGLIETRWNVFDSISLNYVAVGPDPTRLLIRRPAATEPEQTRDSFVLIQNFSEYLKDQVPVKD